MTENQESNKRLHEWFELCWHDFTYIGMPKGVPSVRCKSTCGKEFQLVSCPARGGTDYTTESGFFALLDGLRAKGFRRKNESHALMNDGTNVYRPTGEWAKLFRLDDDGNEIDVSEATADTLPQALFSAAIKAMESEQPTGEGD